MFNSHDDSEENGGGRFSVFRFMFMPQFRYSFEGASHLYPLFVQMIAMTFVAAELLPRHHPATRSGAKDVGHYSIRMLMGEAWYNLRRQRGMGVRAWGLFISIILTCFSFVVTMGAFLGRVFLGLGEAAQAQLFTLPAAAGSGPNLYGGGTDLTALATQAAPPQVGGATVSFDKRFSGQGGGGLIYDDWGLILLDKVVREAAIAAPANPAGAGQGGTLQNALGAIVLVFNTGMVVVAAVMIFWIIVSVVVDTAKTGIVGGGRHNMVWAPIRIIFGLGLMIPLGSTGFSSGQYAVMKLAEWGSNLGTNGWTAYVTAVTAGNDMIAPVVPGGSAGLVNDIAMMDVCEVAYNDYLYQATGPATTTTPIPAGSSDAAQLVGAMNTWSGDGTHLVHAMTNATGAALCGALNISVPAGLQANDPANTSGTLGGFGLAAGIAMGGGWTGPSAAASTAFGQWGASTGTTCGLMGCVMNRPQTTAANAIQNMGQTVIEDGLLILSSMLYDVGGNYLSEGMDTNCTAGCWNPIAYILQNPNAAPTGGNFPQLMAGIRAAVVGSWINVMPQVEADVGGAAGTGYLLTFACSFVAHHAPGGYTNGTQNAQFADINVTGNNVYTNAPDGNNLCAGKDDKGCNANALPAPPTLPGPADDPDYTCHMNAINLLQQAVQPAFGGQDGIAGTVMAAINTWMTANLQGDMARYGWASAGAYYSKVASANVAAQNLAQPSITFVPGVLTTLEATCDADLGTADCDKSGIGYRVAQVMQAYSTWYDVQASTGRGVAAGVVSTNGVAPMYGPGAAAAAGTATGTQFAADKVPDNTSLSARSILSGGKSALMSAISSMLGVPENRGQFTQALIGSVSDNTLPLSNLSAVGQRMVNWGSKMIIGVAVVQGVLGGINLGISTTALGLSCVFGLLFSMCQIIIASGITLAFWVPVMPFIRSAFAVMTWMVSVYEAVIMIPIAALSHLTTEGEGFSTAKHCWVMWLNIVTRPILFVFGFIGAFIIYDSWVVYFTTAYTAAVQNSAAEDNPFLKFIGYAYNCVIYVSTCYAAANAIFKMVDILPASLFKWLPWGGTTDTSFDDGATTAAGYASQASSQFAGTMSAGAQGLSSGISRALQEANKSRPPPS